MGASAGTGQASSVSWETSQQVKGDSLVSGKQRTVPKGHAVFVSPHVSLQSSSMVRTFHYELSN